MYFLLGMFYFTLNEQVIEAKKKLSEEEIKKQIKEKFEMHGMLLADINIVKMMDKNIR